MRRPGQCLHEGHASARTIRFTLKGERRKEDSIVCIIAVGPLHRTGLQSEEDRSSQRVGLLLRQAFQSGHLLSLLLLLLEELGDGKLLEVCCCLELW
jgi:hypothetical protein